MDKKLFSFDAETNGLFGKAFAISAVGYSYSKEWQEEETFIGRCPIEGKVDDYVSANVLPSMINVKENYKSYKELLKAFIDFYLKYRSQNANIIVHMGVPVEAKLLIDAYEYGFIKDISQMPYPLIDISAYPSIGVSVDSYNKSTGVNIPKYYGGEHNPLYDSVAAAVAFAKYIYGLDLYSNSNSYEWR